MEHLVVFIGFVCLVVSVITAVKMELRLSQKRKFSLWVDDEAERRFRSARRDSLFKKGVAHENRTRQG